MPDAPIIDGPIREGSIIEVAVEDHIARILLNRPEALNTINWDLIRRMDAAMEALSRDDGVWAACLEGAGDRAFCAGADLKERKTLAMPDVAKLRKEIIAMVRKITEFPKPLIAAVHGYALGGGFELALACDIIIADETAVFGLTETSLGIIPGAGGTQALPRRIGVGRAKELIFTARRIDARKAERLGVTDRVVPPARRERPLGRSPGRSRRTRPSRSNRPRRPSTAAWGNLRPGAGRSRKRRTTSHWPPRTGTRPCAPSPKSGRRSFRGNEAGWRFRGRVGSPKRPFPKPADKPKLYARECSAG